MAQLSNTSSVEKKILYLCIACTYSSSAGLVSSCFSGVSVSCCTGLVSSSAGLVSSSASLVPSALESSSFSLGFSAPLLLAGVSAPSFVSSRDGKLVACLRSWVSSPSGGRSSNDIAGISRFLGANICARHLWLSTSIGLFFITSPSTSNIPLLPVLSTAIARAFANANPGFPTGGLVVSISKPSIRDILAFLPASIQDRSIAPSDMSLNGPKRTSSPCHPVFIARRDTKSPEISFHSVRLGSSSKTDLGPVPSAFASAGFGLLSLSQGKYVTLPLYLRRLIIRPRPENVNLASPAHRYFSDSISTSAISPQQNRRCAYKGCLSPCCLIDKMSNPLGIPFIKL
eukprot:m.18787 g.18787  ORF g.18787 m.18787 type:complete len:343 (+) comp6400_c0_seq1:85-1113(+)